MRVSTSWFVAACCAALAACGDDDDGPMRTDAGRDAQTSVDAGETLCEQLGGPSAIDGVVSGFVTNVAADPRINGYFLNEGVSFSRLTMCLQLQFKALTACEGVSYPGTSGCRDMVSAHEGLGISMQDFLDLADVLQDTMREAGVSQAHIDTVVGALVPLADDIVEDASNNETIYQRIGRKPALLAVIDDFVDDGEGHGVASNTEINGFFGSTNIPRLKTCLVRQVCAATGGPCAFGGEVGESEGTLEPGVSGGAQCRTDMQAVHDGLSESAPGEEPDEAGIDIADFVALVAELEDAMTTNGLAEGNADRSAILGVLAPMCCDIVEEDDVPNCETALDVDCTP